MTNTTAPVAVKTLKQIILDYNYWGGSESDSPLDIKRSRTPLDDKRILSLDGSMRRKLKEAVPEGRTIQVKTLAEVFKPLTDGAIFELESKISDFKTGEVGIEHLEMSTEAVEFYVQLYSAFNSMTEPKIYYVDAPIDPYVGVFISGKTSDGETIYAQSLLIQTA
jgi:hypothetical protein